MVGEKSVSNYLINWNFAITLFLLFPYAEEKNVFMI